MNWRRLLRLERRLAEDVAERGEMSEPVRVSTDLPFGVKALNEGSPIEGVWDARTTTPLHGPSSRNSSPLIKPAKMLRRSKRDTSTSSIPTLDISDSSSPIKTTGSWAALLEKGAKSTALPLPPEAPETPPEGQSVIVPTRKKSNSITISYSGPTKAPKQSLQIGAVETDSLLYGPASPIESTSADPPSKLRLRRSFTLSNTKRRKFVIGGRSSPTKLVEKPQKPQKVEVNVIDSMNAHRRLHSAEQGQLIPRARPHSEDNTGRDTDYCSCDENATPSRATSWPESNNVRLVQKAPQKAQKAEAPAIEPKKAIIEDRPSPKPCPSSWTGRTQELLDESLNRNVSAGESLPTPSLCSDTTMSTAVGTDDRLSIENKTARKVNDGFELLPAGSFQKQTDVKVISIWPDAEADARDRKRKPNRLQKRHRRSCSASSRGSGTSSESTRSGHFALLGTSH